MRKLHTLLFLLQCILFLPALTAGFLQAPKEWALHLNTAFSSHYTGGGERALLDGIRGDRDFRSDAWQGYLGVNLDVVLDLGSTQRLQSVSVGFLQDPASWIFFPEEVEFWVAQDEVNFRRAGKVASDVSLELPGARIQDYAIELDDVPVRFIRVIGCNRGVCPDRHPGAGKKAWVFADEIIIR